jgi:hypothetical protein
MNKLQSNTIYEPYNYVRIDFQVTIKIVFVLFLFCFLFCFIIQVIKPRQVNTTISNKINKIKTKQIGGKLDLTQIQIVGIYIIIYNIVQKFKKKKKEDF